MPNYFRTPDALVDAVRAVLSGKQTETQEDIIRKADVKMVKVKLPDGRIVMRRDRPEIKVGNEEIDPVNPKALKKMFKDRKDKDIDNDGDVDSSDEYLHNRRKAISKAMKEETDLDEAIKDYEVKIKVGSKTNSYTIPAKDELSAAQSVIHSVIARSKTGGSPGLAAIRKQYPDMKSLEKRGISVSIKEETELGEAKTDAYHKEMLKALGKSKLPKGHQYTSAMASNGDFVVYDGGKRIVGRLKKGEHSIKEEVELEEDIIQKYRDEVSKLEAKKNKTSYEIGRLKMMKQRLRKIDEDTDDNPANTQHLCAKNVVHESWGEGVCIPTMHADPDAEGNVEWYDIMFEHGIETRVSIDELKVTKAESHNHGGKKKKMAENDDMEDDDDDEEENGKKKKMNGKKDDVDTKPSMDNQKMTSEMSDAQMKKREEIVKSMKKKSGDFKKRYGDRAKDVMYATATKMAMKEGFELGIEKSEFIEEVELDKEEAE